MRRRYSNAESVGWIEVFSTSSWWQTGGAVSPWKCRLVETGVIAPLLQGSGFFLGRQIGALASMRSISGVAALKSTRSFLKWITNRSPGFRRNVGEGLPSDVW